MTLCRVLQNANDQVRIALKGLETDTLYLVFKDRLIQFTQWKIEISDYWRKVLTLTKSIRLVKPATRCPSKLQNSISESEHQSPATSRPKQASMRVFRRQMP